MYTPIHPSFGIAPHLTTSDTKPISLGDVVYFSGLRDKETTGQQDSKKTPFYSLSAPHSGCEVATPAKATTRAATPRHNSPILSGRK